MALIRGMASEPRKPSYDVVIVGGAMVGSAVAWFLVDNPGFDGSVLVIERDPSYENSSTAHTNSCMRQQFSNELNIRISQFAAEFVRDFAERLGGPEVPRLAVQNFGYLYLAADEAFAETLRRNQRLQASCGAGTRILSQDELARSFPFFNLDDIVCGSHNTKDEGYFDGGTMFTWLAKGARAGGVEYVADEVVAIEIDDESVRSVTLATGTTVTCSAVVNASGPRAAATARLAGLDIPVEPRPRYTFVFDAQEPLDGVMPLTIDPSGIHVRSDGPYYMAGCGPDEDHAVGYDDFAMDPAIWEDKLWPALANRIPAFERIKVMSRWTGHYAFNTFDHNVIVGPHPRVRNFLFANGFSGHGLQQAPAIGRGIAEWIAYGEYRGLDLTPLGYERLDRGQPFPETAII